MRRELHDIARELHTAAVVSDRLYTEVQALDEQLASKRSEMAAVAEKRQQLRRELVEHAEKGLD